MKIYELKSPSGKINMKEQVGKLEKKNYEEEIDLAEIKKLKASVIGNGWHWYINRQIAIDQKFRNRHKYIFTPVI